MMQLALSKTLEHKIRKLSNSIDAPFYIYDTNRIRQNCQKILDIPYSPKFIHFAMMANSTPQFLKIIKEAGLRIFANSITHLDVAMKLGFRNKEIVFAASAMDKSTMRKVASSGAYCILDSLGQLDQWRALFPDKNVGMRCNIGDLVVPKKTLAGYFIGRESRLGLTPDALKKIKGDSSIMGLHIYVGTNIVDIDYFLECYNQITQLAVYFNGIQFLDFGGGFGLGEKSPDEFDMQVYGKRVTDLMNKISAKLGRSIQLILEPGRIIGGDAGYFVCKVTDVKKRDNHLLIGVNASCVQFPRPLFYADSAYHPVTIIHSHSLPSSKCRLVSSVCGCSTYSRDFLARNVLLPVPSLGDIVVLGYAGSYCATAYTHFLGFPQAQEIFI
jgi:diaminopimelate decarboxylase